MPALHNLCCCCCLDRVARPAGDAGVASGAHPGAGAKPHPADGAAALAGQPRSAR